MHIGDEEVVLVVNAELVRTPHAARHRSERTPVGLQLAIQIVFQDLVRPAVGNPEMLIGRDMDVVGIGNIVPLVQVVAVLVENLDARVGTVGDIDAILGINRNTMDRIELARSRARFAPLEQVFAVLVELHHPRIAVAVADEKITVRQKRDVGGSTEVTLVACGHAKFSERHQQLAVIRELVNHVRAVIDEPDMTVGIIRVHHHAMGSYKQIVVLFPGIDEFAIAIENHEVVLPARVSLGITGRQRKTGRVAFGNDRVRRRNRRQATTLEHVNAIGALRPDATRRTGLPAVSTGIVRPADGNVIRPRDVVAALSLRHGGHGNCAKHQYCHSDDGHVLLPSGVLVATPILRRLRSKCVAAA